MQEINAAFNVMMKAQQDGGGGVGRGRRDDCYYEDDDEDEDDDEYYDDVSPLPPAWRFRLRKLSDDLLFFWRAARTTRCTPGITTHLRPFSVDMARPTSFSSVSPMIQKRR